MFDVAQANTSYGGRDAVTLVRQLHQLGVQLPATCSGIAMPVSVCRALDAGAYASRLLSGLRKLLGRGVAVCLSPQDLGTAETASGAWQRFCALLRQSLADIDHDAARLGFCLPSHQLPLADYFKGVNTAAASGPCYLFLDSLQMESHCNSDLQALTESNWRELWRQRDSAQPLLPVYGGTVGSTCPLLAGQIAMSVLPACGLLVPAHTAWLPLRLSLPAFADRAGYLDEARLSRALRRAVALGDELLDKLDWSGRLQQNDARDNRRLAFIVSGIGDLVLRRGDDPSDIGCLRGLDELMARLRGELVAASAHRARKHGVLPALVEAGAAASGLGDVHRERWQRHFEIAVRELAVRNRNLLVMSPYSVLPTTGTGTPAFTDLLPLIAHADAWSFAAPPAYRGWTIGAFSAFHRRARAIIRGSHAATFVAAGA